MDGGRDREATAKNCMTRTAAQLLALMREGIGKAETLLELLTWEEVKSNPVLYRKIDGLARAQQAMNVQYSKEAEKIT